MAISNALRDPYDENNPTKSIAKPKPLVQTAAVTGAPGLPSPSPATVKPTVPAIARPGASLGTSAGRGFRALTNAGIGATETAANAISYPTRVAGGFLRDAVHGFTGTENPDAGKPAGAPMKLWRFDGQRDAGKPTVAAPPMRKPALPGVRFAGTDAEPDNLFKKPSTQPAQTSQPGTSTAVASPTTFRTGHGRTGTLPAGISMRIGANGVREFSGTGQSVADATAALGDREPAGVTTQSFGSIAMPNLARPQVASTYGLSVTDPRADDQKAIARPQLGPNQTAGGGTLRGPDQMAEQYASHEDRETLKRVLGDIDTDIFRQSLKLGQGGRNARQAGETIAALRGQQAAIANPMAAQSAAAIQGRAGRDAASDLAEMETRSQERRTEIAGANALQLAGIEDATKRAAIAAEIAKPHYDQDRQGNYVQIAGTIARPVLYENGRAVQGQVAKANGEITPAMQYNALNEQLATLLDNPPMQASSAYDQQVNGLRQQIAALTQPRVVVNPKTGERLQYNVQTDAWEPAR